MNTLQSLLEEKNINSSERLSMKPRLFEIGDAVELTLSGSGKYTDEAVGPKYTKVLKSK
jgi:hypothetical protein